MQRKQYKKEVKPRDASQLSVGIVVARFNNDITDTMLQGALETLHEWNVAEKNIYVLHVPGSFEIPFGCLWLLTRHKLDAILTIGCIINGETDHDKYLAHATTEGIMRVSLDHHIPISLGVITTNNLKQAQVRSSGKTNKGREAAIAALELAMV